MSEITKKYKASQVETFNNLSRHPIQLVSILITHQHEEMRKANIFGVRPKRSFNTAIIKCTKYKQDKKVCADENGSRKCPEAVAVRKKKS